MTDFGLIGKAIDYLKSSGQDRKEKKLRERLVEIVNKFEATAKIPTALHSARRTIGKPWKWPSADGF
jgi:DNA invertase Pin-like site-specific DNA recombinase